jgi:nucleotide-binding universal stress UspA family protein
MNRKILVPMDGSENAEKAGEHAISLADEIGADIIVLYVIDTDYLKSIPQHQLREQTDEDLREEGKNAVKKFEGRIEEEKCEGKCKLVNITSMMKEGKPADVILKTIKEEGIDQVVMGKSVKHGIEKFVTENITEKVVKEAKVPVNVIS